MLLRLRCSCKHGYGTHELTIQDATVRPMKCRAKDCDCLVYTISNAVARAKAVKHAA